MIGRGSPNGNGIMLFLQIFSCLIDQRTVAVEIIYEAEKRYDGRYIVGGTNLLFCLYSRVR